ncbi:MATE family efflux transporter [Proteiniclasticum sp. SCR006]|uniref:MATE family efflux transporter n=1 Tax=Proteiniclasticum aestuarii TaxID=2817862 RepID=A0A939KJ10_9CLOT|nr:MATE family efflux transporter [Proteiniclasticum aestuarii]MBO1264703.1 MATE family efflux transporter [Proteiniclasticum aestuarii]
MKDNNTSFYKKMLYFALPVTLQLLITSGLNMVDSLMVGGLGVTAIAAVGIANKYSQFLIITLAGFVSGASIFSAQYFGRKDKDGVKRTLDLVFIYVTLFSLFFGAVTLFFTKEILGIFSSDPVVIDSAVSYVRIIAFTYLLTGWSMLFGVILKTMGIVHKPTAYSITALIVNTFFNWVLIYGALGFPELGIKGAAFATLLARLIQTLLLLQLLFKEKLVGRKTYGTQKNYGFTRRYFALTLPSIFNHLTWTLGDITFFYIFTQVGTNETAAVALVDPLVFIFVCVYTGISDASSVMIGHELGKKSFEKAKEYAGKFLLLTLKLSALTASLILLFSPRLLTLYNITPEVEELARTLLFIFAGLSAFKHQNYVNNVGILRVGGDTTYVLWLDTLTVWAFSIPITFYLLSISAPFPLIYFSAGAHEILRIFFGLSRTRSGKWVNSLVDDTVDGKSQAEIL